MSKREIIVPILRSFSHDGNHYVYGVLPFKPDSFGTMLSYEIVIDNLDRLKAFPTARFQHANPIGVVDFEQNINGYRTYVDKDGFHVLIKIFNACEKEFSMIAEGSYGLSYGLLPKKTEHATVNGNQVEVFTEGTLYEVSVVDSPAIPQPPITIVRSNPKRLSTVINGEVVEITPQADGSFSTRYPETEEPEKIDLPNPTHLAIERMMQNPNIEEERKKLEFPDVCSEQCSFITCGFRRPVNFGKKCLQKEFWELKNR